MRAWPILAFLCAALIAASASAHTRSESHELWEIGPRQVDLILTVPVAVVAPLGSRAAPASDEVLKGYLSTRAYPIAEGQRCKLTPPIETLSATAGFRKFDLTFACPQTARGLRIHSDAFMDLAPSHVSFAQIQDVATGELTEQLLTRDRPTADVVGASGELANARFFDFVGMGVMHIFTGIDHMSFLLGLVLISRRLRDLLFVVTGFTLGHSLTLALAVTGVVRPHAEYIDALVALTIALIGVENLAVSTGRSRTTALAAGLFLAVWVGLRALGHGTMPIMLLIGAALFVVNYLIMTASAPNPARLRMVMTVVFGLIHGFGFAANLLEMQLPPNRIAELLVGFNLGVEVGQTTLVLVAVGLAWLLSRTRFAVPRPILTEASAALLILLGVNWFVVRTF